MLISMIVALLFGGGAQNLAVSTEDYREKKAEIMDVMQDIEQRQEVIKVLYKLKRDSKKYSRKYLKHFNPIFKELGQYDVRHDMLDEELAQVDAVRQSWQEAVITARFKLRDLMTRDEWEAVFGICDY
jgi:hypothetical protein